MIYFDLVFTLIPMMSTIQRMRKGKDGCCAHAIQYPTNIVVGDYKYTIAIFTKFVEVGKGMDSLV